MIKLRIIGTAFLCAAALAACKKNSKDTEPDTPPPTTPTTGTRLQLSLDTLYLFAKETYLWYDAIPDYSTFNPRGFAGSDDLASLKNAMYKISQLKENPATQKPYEYYVPNPSRSKFSFVESGNLARGIKGAVDLEGSGNDMGFQAIPVTFANDPTPGKRYVYVAYVEKGSPAAEAGLTRGCEITKMNGGNPPTDAGSLNSLINGNTLSLEFTKTNGTKATANLTKKTYTNDPVTAYKVIQGSGTNKIGYLNLMRFSRLSVADNSLDEAFAEFATAGVNNLVIDLRYNGGGYVETFEYLANLIIPNAMNGKVMYKEQFNTLLQEGKAPILKSLPLLDANYQQRYSNGKPLTYADVDFTLAGNVFYFAKKGTLDNVRKVVFIMTGSTASASELTINSLAAYPANIDVKTVGSKSYGKPVGFFGIGIDKFTVYMSQFTSTNALNKGDYFDGFTPDMAEQDLVTRDFGDPLESSLAKAINYINTGSTTGRLSDARIATANGNVVNASDLRMEPVESAGFNGMIEHRRRLKSE